MQFLFGLPEMNFRVSLQAITFLMRINFSGKIDEKRICRFKRPEGEFDLIVVGGGLSGYPLPIYRMQKECWFLSKQPVSEEMQSHRYGEIFLYSIGSAYITELSTNDPIYKFYLSSV